MRGKGGSGPGLTSDVAVLDMPVDRRARYTNAMAADTEGGRGLRRAGCVSESDGDRESVVSFPGLAGSFPRAIRRHPAKPQDFC